MNESFMIEKMEAKQINMELINLLFYTKYHFTKLVCILCCVVFFLFFIFIEFQFMVFAFNNWVFYHQNKTLMSFWYMWELNPKSFIQLSKTLSIVLIRTQFYVAFVSNVKYGHLLQYNYFHKLDHILVHDVMNQSPTTKYK